MNIRVKCSCDKSRPASRSWRNGSQWSRSASAWFSDWPSMSWEKRLCHSESWEGSAMVQGIRSALGRKMIDTAELDRALLPLFERIEERVVDGLPLGTLRVPREPGIALNGSRKWQDFFSSWAFSMSWLLEAASAENIAEASAMIAQKFLNEMSRHRLHAISPIAVLPWHAPEKTRVGYLIRFSILTSGADEPDRVLAGFGPASRLGSIPIIVHDRIPV